MKRRRRKRKPEDTISCEIDELGPRKERDGNTYMYEDIVFDADIFQESNGFEPNWIEARIGHATCYRGQLNEKSEEVMRMLLTIHTWMIAVIKNDSLRFALRLKKPRLRLTT